VIDTVKPELIRNVITEATSKTVRETLESVVAKGTGRNAFIDGYRVGGKTGTAQKVINGRYSADEHIVSFVGFAPADNPKIVIYAAVDDPQGLQFGGLIAAPMVKNMMEDALRYMKVEPSRKQIERDYRYGEIPLVEVPNLVGASITDIYEDMNDNFMLAKSGNGKYVLSQAPKPGTKMNRGSTIRIFLNDTPPADTETPK
jgi:stage V sporulation protein D (sporulation-specific penicillin-binding protein)